MEKGKGKLVKVKDGVGALLIGDPAGTPTFSLQAGWITLLLTLHPAGQFPNNGLGVALRVVRASGFSVISLQMFV